MSKFDKLTAEVRELRSLLRQHGIVAPGERPDTTKQHDYVEHGSAQHAQIIGLIEARPEDDTSGYITFKSPQSGRTWRLHDEVTPFMQHANPRQVAELVLRQKVSELDAGQPQVPEGAPSMWQPERLAYTF